MAVDRIAQESLFESALYCEEEKWGDVEQDEEEEVEESGITSDNSNLDVFPLLEQDLLWDDEELESLLCKERETKNNINDETGGFFSLARKEAVEWILRINAHYGFSPLTAILAVNYFYRFLCSFRFQQDKPWMMQLAAVTCLSLASKVEETHVPLLLDLQVEDAKYVFDAKTIQRMELLVLSSLKWRMNPVTPLSFIHHIIRRVGLKCYVHLEFLRSCENLLLSVISDARFCHHLPSVIATATMLHVIHQLQPLNSLHYEIQLLTLLKTNQEEVDDCYKLVAGIASCKKCVKRKEYQIPDGVMDGSTSDTSNVFKKRRMDDDGQGLCGRSCVESPLIKTI